MKTDEGIILGALLGDGCLSSTKSKNGTSQYSVTLTSDIKNEESFLLEIMKPKFEKIFKCKVNVIRQPEYGKLDLRIYSKNVLLKMVKMWNLSVGKSRKKTIPKKFLNDRRLMKFIVSGFFATDGSFVITNNNGSAYPRIEFQNISGKLLNQTRNFLSKSINLKGGGLYLMKRKSWVYRLQYNGIENLMKFQKEIGFINPKQQMKFEEFMIERLG